MIKIYLSFFCLLSALSIVEMKPLNVEGRVGENVTFNCSDWNAWVNLEQNVKYFCDSPCSTDRDIISKAAFGETKHNNRITLVNRGKGLFVTFTNLQKSDFKTYICGVDRAAFDSLIKVNLIVRAAEASSPKTTPEPVVAGSTLSSADTTTVSSTGSEIMNDNSASYTTVTTPTPASSSTAQGAGSIPYLIVGVFIIIIILMVSLKFMHKMIVTKPKVVQSDDRPQEETEEDVEYSEIRPADRPDPDCLYANYYNQQGTKLAESGNSHSKEVSLNPASRSEVNARGACADSRVTGPQCDLVYSVVQLPKEQSEPNQSESNGNDSLYSVAQLPRAT